ncbi:hypothetical protein ACLBWX_22670 [Methylobacterium sp. M6A4_1b]
MIVGVISHPNFSTALCFDGLMQQQRYNFIFINPFEDSQLSNKKLQNVDVVVVVRHLYLPEYENLWREAFRGGIPMYYLLDDNFFIIDSGDVEGKYTHTKVRNTLRMFKGVLSSNVNLSTYLISNKIHSNVLWFSAVRDSDRDPQVISKHNGEAINIGCFGGGFRLLEIEKNILPALSNMAKIRPVSFYAREDLEALRDKFESAGINFQTSKTTDSIGLFCRDWLQYNLDIIIHPPGNTKNLAFKTANALLIAYYLGAVPVVADEPAYAGSNDKNGVIIADCTEEAYFSAFQSLAGRKYRQNLFAKLELYVRKAFATDSNIRTLDIICNQIDL